MVTYGYTRVSIRGGTGAARPGLKACLDYLRRGDVVLVLDLDRLGRRVGGGGIAVASRLGEGSTFTVTLPLTLPEQDRPRKSQPEIEG